jgi:hypothetical protein
MTKRTKSAKPKRSRRAPSPFAPLYAPAWWRERAWLDGRHLADLVRAWQRLSWSAIAHIAIENRDGSVTYAFRDAADHRMMPYPTQGPGTLSRLELREHHELTDRELERRVRSVLGIRVRLAGGRDTPKKKWLRWQAYDRTTNDTR